MLCIWGRAIVRVVLMSGWIIWGHRKQKPEFGWRWLWVCCLSFLELYSHIWALTIEKVEHLFLLPVSEASICPVPITARFKVRQFWLPYKRSFTQRAVRAVLLTETYIRDHPISISDKLIGANTQGQSHANFYNFTTHKVSATSSMSISWKFARNGRFSDPSQVYWVTVSIVRSSPKVIYES